MGEFEKALASLQEAYRLKPSPNPRDVSGLMAVYRQLDRFDEAKAVAETVIARGNDGLTLHWHLLGNAYAQADREGAAKQIEWFTGKPEEYS